MKTAVIPRSILNQGRIRFEGKFYLNDDSLNSMKVESHKDKCISVSYTHLTLPTTPYG